MDELLTKVKANLILDHDTDDVLLTQYITAAMAYAESYQHIPEGSYSTSLMPPTTEQMPLGETTLASVFTVLPTFGVSVPLKGTALRSEFEVRPRFGVLVPAVPAILGSEFKIAGSLWAKIPLRGMAVASELNLTLKSIRTEESEEMVLEGLDLRPGQSLVIDTDTLEIIVDDQPRVDCWVTGGSFFQFKNGKNVLSFSDNAARRNLQVTVIWADRYL